MNKIFIGLDKTVDRPPGGHLFMDDEVPDIPRSRVFDPTVHCFNPLKDLDYRKACDFVDTIDALFPRGESTLTKDTGLDFISDALDKRPSSLATLIPEPDSKSSSGHIWAHGKIKRLLRSPVLKPMLTNPTNFSFNPRSIILARVNRAELGEFDALAIGLFLMNHYKGQLVVPDFGFYAREYHSSLVREDRLIARVNFLDELPPKLRQLCLLQDTMPSGTTYEDAKILATIAQVPRDTGNYTNFIDNAMKMTAATAPQPVRSFLVERTRQFAAQQFHQRQAGDLQDAGAPARRSLVEPAIRKPRKWKKL